MRTGTSREPWWSLHSEEIEIERRLAASLSILHETAPHLPALATRLDECVPVVRRIAAQLKRGQRGRRSWPVAMGPGLFEVAVSPQTQLRALCTLDRVIRHCVASGLRLVADDTSDRPAHFLVEGQALSMRLFESAEREMVTQTDEQRARVRADPELHRWKRDKFFYRPTGVLRLVVKPVGLNWVALSMFDAARTPLGERIADFPMKLQLAALRLRLRDEVREESRIGFKHRADFRAEREALKHAALAKLGAFEEMALKLERARRLRVLAAALSSTRDAATPDSEGGGEEPGNGAGDGAQAAVEGGNDDAQWLLNAADWLDPTVRKHWSVVDGDPPPHGPPSVASS